MTTNMKMAEGILGRCQSCLKNLFHSICDFTCAADQSRFMKATETRENEAGQTIIESIEVSITFFFKYFISSVYKILILFDC